MDAKSARMRRGTKRLRPVRALRRAALRRAAPRRAASVVSPSGAT